VVFIDDQPVERARVREALPEVYVPEWPQDPMLYPKALLSLSCFDNPSVSQEDLQRAQMYVIERRREELKSHVGSIDVWLSSLGVTVTLAELGEENLSRTVQLFNKTNQMNLSTRRTTEAELLAWAAKPTRKLWTVHVSDKFGPSGLTGIISLEAEEGVGRIADFILSCRVMGRKVEETMVAALVQYAQSVGLQEVQARYLPTTKNAPCLEFWKRSGFQQVGDSPTFCWRTDQPYPFPPQVTVELPSQSVAAR
jgi:FkbH-like protein